MKKYFGLFATAVLMSIALFLFLIPQPCAAQSAASGHDSADAGEDIVIGKKIKLVSSVLGEDRQLLVYLPDDYAYSGNRYPVLYLLDGYAYFSMTVGYIRLLASQGDMPDMIVVALVNTDRDRDFLPTHMNHVRTSGGGDHFMKFFKKELIPYIDQHYRTADYRILAGHSFGGLFSVYTLFTKPDLFNAYIAVSPSLHWDNGLVIKRAVAYMGRTLALKKYLYMAMGNEGDAMLNSIGHLSKILKEHPPVGLKWHYRFMKEENHGTMPHRGFFDGLRILYQGWRLPPKATTDGLKGLKKFYKSQSKKYGYDIPIPESALNLLGYSLLFKRHPKEAIDTFLLNLRLHPDSPNAYDSLGEAYEAVKQLDEAKKYYQLAIEKARKVSHPALKVFESHLTRVETKK